MLYQMPSQEGVNHPMQLVWDQEGAEKIIKNSKFVFI